MVAMISKRTAKEVQKEVRAIKKAGREICKTPESAREFLHKHGFITKDNKLTKTYS
jgi:hypothetical protein